jgi:hypothetical protein
MEHLPGAPLSSSSSRSYFAEAQVPLRIAIAPQSILFYTMFIILFQKKYEIALLGYTQSDLDTIRQTLELASVSCAASIETS